MLLLICCPSRSSLGRGGVVCMRASCSKLSPGSSWFRLQTREQEKLSWMICSCSTYLEMVVQMRYISKLEKDLKTRVLKYTFCLLYINPCMVWSLFLFIRAEALEDIIRFYKYLKTQCRFTIRVLLEIFLIWLFLSTESNCFHYCDWFSCHKFSSLFLLFP